MSTVKPTRDSNHFFFNVNWTRILSFIFLYLSFAQVSSNKGGGSDGIVGQHSPRSIPLLSVSLNLDRRGYMARLIRSIDYPIDRVIVQIGNADPTIVSSISNDILGARDALCTSPIGICPNASISTMPFNPGSANGFNFGLRYMMQNSTAKWVLVVNSDIAFYPGVLSKLARSVNKALQHIQSFGIGFTSLCCDSEWSAVIFSRRLVARVGFMDENFYPAYYEDDDYAIRVHLSGFRAMRFNGTALQHGELDGSKDYLSGIFEQLYMNPDKKLMKSAAMQSWQKMFVKGQAVSKDYIEKKWGMHFDKKKKGYTPCKSVEGINQLCRPGYTRPFNDPTLNLSSWTLDQNLRDSIIQAGKI